MLAAEDERLHARAGLLHADCQHRSDHGLGTEIICGVGPPDRPDLARQLDLFSLLIGDAAATAALRNTLCFLGRLAPQALGRLEMW